MWGVLGILNRISDGFMKGHRHMQLNFGMMEKREKLLAIYDAIPPTVWAEMDLQLLFNSTKFKNMFWSP